MSLDRKSGVFLAAFALIAVLSLPAMVGAQEAPPAETAPADPAAAAEKPAEVPAESSVDPAASPEQRRGPTDVKELEAFVDGIMEAQLTDKHIAGATIAVVVDNKPFFTKGYGYADVAARKPVNPDETMFRVGSVSKLFTWTAVMQLVEQGKLDLDADINKYLKDFQIPATYPEPVTLRHLLSHTPGFEDKVVGLFGRGPDETPLGQLLARSLPARVRKPGELASYSNHGTAIAGYIVQEVSGEPWADYIEAHLLKPLSMDHTTVRQPAEDKLPAEMSKGYKYAGGKFIEQGFEYVPPAPAGSMSAAAGDIIKFMIAHLQNGEYEGQRILKEDTARQMHSLLFTHDPRLEGMAYGFMRMNYGGEQIIEHGGDTFAFHSYFVMLPERKAGFFVSYNTTTAGSSRTTLLKALLDRYYPPPQLPPAKAPADFAERAGRYRGQFTAIRHSYTDLAKLAALFGVLNVSVDGDELLVADDEGEGRRWVEVEPLVFREVGGQRMLAFREDNHGNLSHLFFSGSPVAFVRLPWYESPLFTLLLIVGCVGILLSAVIGWPLAAFINRGHGGAAQRTAGSKLASWIGWLASLAILVVIGLAMIPFAKPDEIAFGIPDLLVGLQWSTLAIIALVAAAFLCSLVAWARGYWRVSGRLHYTCVMVAGLAFAWFLYHWQMFPVTV